MVAQLVSPPICMTEAPEVTFLSQHHGMPKLSTVLVSVFSRIHFVLRKCSGVLAVIMFSSKLLNLTH